MLQGIRNWTQSTSLYLTATCKIRWWPCLSFSVAAQPGLVASSSTPETCQHLCRERAGPMGATCSAQATDPSPKEGESKVRCRRTLRSCCLHPSSSSPIALGCPTLLLSASLGCQAVPKGTLITHPFFHSGRLNPDREFISMVEGPWDRRLFQQYKVGRSRQKHCFIADGLTEKERRTCKGKVL